MNALLGLEGLIEGFFCREVAETAFSRMNEWIGL